MTSAPLRSIGLEALPELLAAVPELQAEVRRLREEVDRLTRRTVDPLEDLVTPQQLVAGGTVTMGQLRDYLKFRHTNGLGRHVSARGRRLRISRKGFATWLAARRG